MINLSLYHGEYRNLMVTLSNKDASDFIIQRASYTLSREGEIVDSGDCVVDGKKLIVYLNPKDIGFHVLEYTIYIAHEIIIKRINIQVL